MEIKDSCLKLLKRQVWHFKPSKCTLWIRLGSSSNFWGDVTFNIYSMPQLCEAILLTANASGVLSSRGGHLCLFSIRSGTLISPLSLHQGYTLRYMYQLIIHLLKWADPPWWTTRSLTYCNYWFSMPIHISTTTKPSNSASDSCIYI